MNRREFITGLIAAPAIVRIDSIMPVKKIIEPVWLINWDVASTDLAAFGTVVFNINDYKITRIPPDQWSKYDIR